MAETQVKKEKPVMQYVIDGRPITNPSVNNLANIAYFYTKGVDGERARINVKELKALIEKLGFKGDPKAEVFSVTLPNGKVLSAEVGKLAEKVARVKKADQPEAVAKRRASTDRVARMKRSQEQAKALKAWKGGGEQGERPDTTDLDALTTQLEQRPTKGARKVAKQAKIVSIKPSKGNGKTIKKAPAAKKAAPASGVAPKKFSGPITKESQTRTVKKAAAR
jgi:hypothetical protein